MSILDPEPIDIETIDRVCRGVASVQEGERVRVYIRALEARAGVTRPAGPHAHRWRAPHDCGDPKCTATGVIRCDVPGCGAEKPLEPDRETVCERSGDIYSGAASRGETIACPGCGKLVTLRTDIHVIQIPRHLKP